MDQVELMEHMNKLLQKQLETLVAISDKMTGQSGTFQQVTQSANDYAAANDRVAEASNAAAEAGDKAATSMGSISDSIKSFVGDKAYDRFTNGFKDGVSLLAVNFESLAQIVSNPVSAAFGFLGELYDKIIAKAAELAKESQQLTIAMERVREKFGSFNEPTSRRVVSSFKTFGDTLKTTGENARQFGRKFEPGVAGSIAKLEKMTEIMEDTGPMIDVMGEQFVNAKDSLYLLKDGLGFTSESLKQTAVMASLSGKSWQTMNNEILASVNKIGKQFGVSTKALGADVGKALSNFKMLGRMTGDYVKEITKAAVFTRKLGFELDELTGLVDKFDEFEGGAEAAAQLAQGFGLVVDPLKMLGLEAGPRLQELQRAFAATGRSIDSMSRQERKLLADTAGLTEKQATLAFSTAGMSMSYDQISAGAEAATKKQKTTEEIMNDVLDNIKNIIVEFKDFTGFITAFFEGFGRGFMGEGSVMGLIRKLAVQLMQVAHIGEQVGRMFAKVIFGGNDTKSNGKAVLDLFSRVGDMFVEISEHIKTFVDAMESGDIVAAAQKMFGGIFGSIEKMFTSGVGGINLGSMVSKMGMFFFDMLTGAAKFLISKIPEWTKQLTFAFTSKGTNGITGGLTRGVGDAIKGLTDVLPDLAAMLPDLAAALMGAVGRFFKEFPLVTLFVSGGPIMTTLGGIVAGFFGMLGDMFKTEGEAAATGGGSSPGAAAAASAMSGGVTTAVTGAAAAAVTDSKSFLDRVLDILETPAKITAMSGAIAIAIGVLGKAIHDVLIQFLEPQDGRDKSFVEMFADAAKKMKDVSIGDIAVVGAIIGGVFLAIGAMLAAVGLAAVQLSKTSGLGLFLGAALATAVGPTALFAFGGAAVGLMGMLIRSVKDLIIEIATGFTSPEALSAFEKLPQIESKLPALKSVTDMMKSLVSTLVSVSQALPGPSFADQIKNLLPGGNVNSATDSLTGSVGRLVAVLNGDPKAATEESRKGILSIMGEINIPPSVAGKSAGISSVMDAVNKMVAATSNLAKIDAVTLSTAGDSLSFLPTIVDTMTIVFDSLGSMNIDVKQMAAREQLLKGAIAVMRTYVSSMAEIPTAQFTAAQENIAASSTLIDSMTSSGTGGPADLADAIKQMVVLDQKTSDAKLAGLNSMLAVFDSYGEGIARISYGLSAEKLEMVEKRVTALVTHVSMMRGILQDLDSISIDATIDRLEKNMSVAKQAFSVNGGAVNISVNLNVTMNAEKMAAALVLGGYVDASTEFGDYMKTGYKNPKNTDKIFNGTTPPDFGGYEGFPVGGGT
jgi:hypothetical protein